MSYKPSPEELSFIKKWMPLCKNDLPLFAEKLLGISLHDGQRRMADAMKEKFYPVNLALIPNRWGKTVFVAIKHIYKNFYKECGPGVDLREEDWPFLEYQTLNVAPSSENTKIMLKMVLQMCRGEFSIRVGSRLLGNKSYLKYFVDAEGLNNYHKIPDQGPFGVRFANKSLFRCFTLGQSHGDAIQGDKYGYGSYDEFGRSKNPEKEMDDIIPRLTDQNGELDIITTPDMENELTIQYLMEKKEFAELPDTTWRFINGSYDENTYIPTAEREQRLMGMSEEKKRQILFGEICLTGANYFDTTEVQKMFNQNLYNDSPPVSQHEYYVGLDTSGDGQDYWAVAVYDVSVKPFRKVYYYYDKKKQPHVNIGITSNIIERYAKAAKKVQLVMDKTNEAGAIYYSEFSRYQPIGYRFGTQKGTGKSTKAELLDTYRRGVNAGLLVSPTDTMLKNQMTLYKGPSDDTAQTTDALMANALAVYYPLRDMFDLKEDPIYDV